MHGEFAVTPSSENTFVAAMVCGRHCRTPFHHEITYYTSVRPLEYLLFKNWQQDIHADKEGSP